MPRAAGRTDIGRCRAVNEDTFDIVAAAGALVVGVYDGCGSFGADTAREGASFEAARFVRESLAAAPPPASSDEAGRRIADALRAANRSLFDRAAAWPLWRGLSTSATIASIVGHQLAVAQVGDTRAYVLRAGALRLVSADHTLLAVLLAEGHAPPADGLQNYQNIVTRSIGALEDVEVDTSSLELCDGDTVLLCTDGLWKLVGDARITAILGVHPDPAAACAALIDAADAAGGHDNVAVVAVAV
jgi:protein phosphatase